MTQGGDTKLDASEYVGHHKDVMGDPKHGDLSCTWVQPPPTLPAGKKGEVYK